MNAWRKAAVFVAAVATGIGAAGALAAQGAPNSKCDIDEGSPFQLKSARIYIDKSRGGKPDEVERHLKDAVRVLTDNPDRINNQVGRNWLLGQALVVYELRPGAKRVVKRSDVGYSTNPDQPIDLYAAVDTAFSAVEAAKPECKSETVTWRRQLWTPAINDAAKFINAKQFDSAEAALGRANAVWQGSPNAPYYAAAIAQGKNDPVAAAGYFRQTGEMITPEMTKADPSLEKIRSQSIYNAGVLYQQLAEMGSDSSKRGEYTKQATSEYRAFLASYPSDQLATSAQTNLARLLGSAGDTRTVDSIYSAMLNDPTKYNDTQLFEAGTALYNLKRFGDAAKVFEAGLAKNANFRDAIFNVTQVYFAEKDGQKLLESAKRLATVDPNNPVSWRLIGAGFQQLQQNATDAAKKKALTDSIIKYLNKEKETNPKVTGLQLMHNGANHTLTGTVQNAGTAPGNYNIKVEFLDGQGNVLATQSAPVSVAPGQSKQFRIDVTQTGIVAFRYAPLS